MMPHPTRTIALILSLGVTSAALAATEAPGEADHQALRQLMTDASNALSTLDTTTLQRLLTKDFIVTFADQTVITNRSQLDDYVSAYFTADDAPLKSIRIVPEASEQTRFIDSHTGVVHGVSADSYTLADGSALTLDTHWTATVVKQGDDWRVKTFHSGANILDNPILDAVQKSSLWWGGIGLVAGLVAGAVLGRSFGRRASH